jgi:hypothetical protein
MAAEVFAMPCEDADLLEALTEAWVALSLHLLRNGYCHSASCAALLVQLLKAFVEAEAERRGGGRRTGEKTGPEWRPGA